ncbi:SigB/SigF/SigG family RNA polymerase sigma factor [Streptomyces fuscigenes]|uniref:SigB/SigF/SigG family RNA polymerase sigma factor n=1 Tax=Streptomyces fuscigenes TaxID=1528880 RepID=UPI001F32A724|nr:SigB/SigF/SigG family RNA polymerase sigma factor [Streptomyces fuscigenes]MCF3962303.1 SigB/SigF/SigG family RNA polymerase sigma factor [Streptomyces fuscigenes]
MTSPAGTPRIHDDAPDTAADFFRLRAASDGPERERLCQEIAEAWLPMAHRIARGYRERGESLDDLRQVAALGLTKAINRFDPTLGKAFETYAVPTIKGELRRHFRDFMWSVHVPRRVQDLRNQVRRARQELSQEPDGQSPTSAAVAAHCGLTEEEVRQGMSALGSFSALSLDAPALTSGGDGSALGDLIGSSDPSFDLVADREAVKPCLSRLPAREQRILYLRYFEDMTQSMIAEELGVSQMHISRLISRTCERLRDEALAGAAA